MENFNWQIISISSVKESGAVIKASWNCFAKKPLNDTDLVASKNGEITFHADPSSSSFIPFENLTETDVLNWVWNKVGKKDVEQKLTAQLNNFNPDGNPSFSDLIPWQKKESEIEE